MVMSRNEAIEHIRTLSSAVASEYAVSPEEVEEYRASTEEAIRVISGEIREEAGMKHLSGTVFHNGAFVGGYGFGLEEQYIGLAGHRTLFGLTYKGEWTHMRYEIERGKTLREFVDHAGANGGNFFFDVGNRVTVQAGELERVAKEFGIW